MPGLCRCFSRGPWFLTCPLAFFTGSWVEVRGERHWASEFPYTPITPSLGDESA